MGISFHRSTGQPTICVISRFRATFELVLYGMVLAIGLAIPLGVSRPLSGHLLRSFARVIAVTRRLGARLLDRARSSDRLFTSTRMAPRPDWTLADRDDPGPRRSPVSTRSTLCSHGDFALSWAVNESADSARRHDRHRRDGADCPDDPLDDDRRTRFGLYPHLAFAGHPESRDRAPPRLQKRHHSGLDLDRRGLRLLGSVARSWSRSSSPGMGLGTIPTTRFWTATSRRFRALSSRDPIYILIYLAVDVITAM